MNTKKQMPKAKHQRQEKGITLIALVITVIVLLILAGTAISIAVNGNNIFAKANTAVNSYNAKAEQQKTAIDALNTQFDNYYTGYNPNQNPGGNPPEDPTLPAAWGATAGTYVAEAYTDGTADTRQVPIPKGFVASSATGENAIATGLVIYKGTEAVTDSNVATAQTSRDQYVWIPVDNSDTITWANETDDTNLLTGTDDATKEANLTLSADFAAMKTSVQTYGGFYISRYELGGTVSSPTSIKGREILTAQTNSANQWYGLYDAAHQDITDGTNTVLKGHMIFGSEHEKVLAFIDSNNVSYSTTAHENKQQTVKHASGIIEEGQTDKELDIVNNIIDLEGNVMEWTAQAYGTDGRVLRGGSYDDEEYYGHFFSAYNSAYSGPTWNEAPYAVRQALYVTL